MHFAKFNFLFPFFLCALLPVSAIFSEKNDHWADETHLGSTQEDLSPEDSSNSSNFPYDTNHSLHFKRANTIAIGPEIYRVCRERAGGTKQNGNLAAIRVTYDHIRRYRCYFGAQLFYGSGILRGHTGGSDKIRSRLTEKMIEANAGYTFQAKCFPHLSFTPFAGYGYFRDVNKFSPPSSLQIKFTTQFRYLGFGFLSSIYALPCLTIGINARFKWPWQTRCKVTDDPDFETIRQIVKDKLQYRIEVPFTYFGCLMRNQVEIAVIPFFEQRVYGARENFPFDFFKTKFTLYGGNVQLIYRF